MTTANEAVEVTQDWFKRNADRRNPDAFIHIDPAYFASECADAIINGHLASAAGQGDREAIARIIDPYAWSEAESYRERADEWFAKGRTEPGDALTDGYRSKAVAMLAPSLAKADAILALQPDTRASGAAFDAARDVFSRVIPEPLVGSKYREDWETLKRHFDLPQPDTRAARCEYCDGTGDVHRADGEWLGSCDCPDTRAAPDAGLREAVVKLNKVAEKACLTDDDLDCFFVRTLTRQALAAHDQSGAA